MSINRRSGASFLEGRHGFRVDRRLDERLQPVAVDDIDGLGKQRRDARFEADIGIRSGAFSGSISIMMPISLSGRLSPRAREPNKAARMTPRARRSGSLARNLAMIACLSRGLS
jgi:hypothetical protein